VSRVWVRFLMFLKNALSCKTHAAGGRAWAKWSGSARPTTPPGPGGGGHHVLPGPRTALLRLLFAFCRLVLYIRV